MSRVDTTASFSPVLTSPPPEPGGRRLPWRALCVAFFLLWCLGLAQAQPPLVRELALQRTPEALYVSARLDLVPTPVVQDALTRGVPLYFVWQADVYRQRWYWTDKRVGGASRILRLAYQPLTRRWRVSLSTDASASGGGAGLQYALHQNHDSLAEALASIGRLYRWRLAEANALQEDEDHRVELAFRLDLTLLPRPFQIGVANESDWRVTFEQRLRVPDKAVPETPAEGRVDAAGHAEPAGDTSRRSDDTPSR